MEICIEKPIVSVFDASCFVEKEKYDEAYLKVSEERRKKVDAYRFEKDKRLSLAAGLLLEEGLRQFGVENYSLRYGENNKPYLNGMDNLFFNLSHSGNFAVCALYDKEIGVDIEKISDVSEVLIRKVTAEREYNFLMSLNEIERKDVFFRIWAIKESYIKYLGTGLSVAPERLEIIFGDKIGIKHNGAVMPAVFEEYNIEGYRMALCY